MRYKKLGLSAMNISVIGLGTWALGGPNWQFGWGQQDDQESVATIHHAMDKGINWIDTAAVYGLGYSETIVGKALQGMSEKPYVFTKCARTWNEKGEIDYNLKKDNIKKECEDSLRRLRIDVIDLYQIHWPVPDEDIEEGWGAIAELVKEGKVRYGGVSNFNVSQMQRAQHILPVTSLQPPYNMLARDVEKEILPWCGQQNIGVICYSPMYKGLLTGKLTRERIEAFDASDHRSRDKRLQEPELSINLELVEGLKVLAKDRGITPLQLALAWVLRRQEVSGAIVGARRPDQVDEIITGGAWEMSAGDDREIEALLNKREQALKTV